MITYTLLKWLAVAFIVTTVAEATCQIGTGRPLLAVILAAFRRRRRRPAARHTPGPARVPATTLTGDRTHRFAPHAQLRLEARARAAARRRRTSSKAATP